MPEPQVIEQDVVEKRRPTFAGRRSQASIPIVWRSYFPCGLVRLPIPRDAIIKSAKLSHDGTLGPLKINEADQSSLVGPNDSQKLQHSCETADASDVRSLIQLVIDRAGWTLGNDALFLAPAAGYVAPKNATLSISWVY